jgi:pilus assembly protein Flp/PilA
MRNLARRLWCEDGQDLVEYSLLLALISLAAMTGMKGLATAINSTFGKAAANLSAAS